MLHGLHDRRCTRRASQPYPSASRPAGLNSLTTSEEEKQTSKSHAGQEWRLIICQDALLGSQGLHARGKRVIDVVLEKIDALLQVSRRSKLP